MSDQRVCIDIWLTKPIRDRLFHEARVLGLTPSALAETILRVYLGAHRQARATAALAAEPHAIATRDEEPAS
jgi:hypothetical protein